MREEKILNHFDVMVNIYFTSCEHLWINFVRKIKNFDAAINWKPDKKNKCEFLIYDPLI